MHQQSVHDLPPDLRKAFETFLGHALREEEIVSVRVLRQEPTREARAAALEAQFAKTDAQRPKNISDAEIEDILDEAMRSVRPGFQRVDK